MVRAAGLEPARYYYRGILSPLRLPVPPCPRRGFFVVAKLCFSFNALFWLYTQSKTTASQDPVTILSPALRALGHQTGSVEHIRILAEAS